MRAIPIIAAGATTTLVVGAVALTMHGAIPREYSHHVHVDGKVSVEVTVNAPDLAKFKPGQLVPDRITIVLPDGFTLRLPDTTQTVKVPTDYTVHQK